VVLIGDVHVMASPYVITNLDCQMPNNATAPADQTTVTDAYYGRGNAFLARHHAG
jgi:hypothetical protein